MEYYYNLEGKNRLCTAKNHSINKIGTTINDLIRFKISFTTFCKEICEFRDECKYQCNCGLILSKEGGVKNWISTHYELKAIMEYFLFNIKENIILIIDEDFSNALKTHFILNDKILMKNIYFLNKLLLRLDDKKDKDYKKFIRIFIKFLNELLNSIKNRVDLLDYEKIYNLYNDLDLFNSADFFSDGYVNMLNDDAFEMIRNNEIKPFKFLFYDFASLFDNLFNYDVEKDDIEEWMKSAFYIKKYVKKDIQKYKISFLFNDFFKIKKILDHENIFKVIFNNATAQKQMMENITPDLVEHFDDWSYENCEFHQLKILINKKKKIYMLCIQNHLFFIETHSLI